MHVLPTFSDLLIALKKGNDSNGNNWKDCEITIAYPIQMPIYSYLMRGFAFHKVDNFGCQNDRGI